MNQKLLLDEGICNEIDAKLGNLIEAIRTRDQITEDYIENLKKIMCEKKGYYEAALIEYIGLIKKDPTIDEPLRNKFFCHTDSRDEMHLILVDRPQNSEGYAFNASQGNIALDFPQYLVFPITHFLKEGALYDQIYERGIDFVIGLGEYKVYEQNIFFDHRREEGAKWLSVFPIKYSTEDYVPVMTLDGVSKFLGYIAENNIWPSHLDKLSRMFVYDSEKIPLDITLGFLVNSIKGKSFFEECNFNLSDIEEVDLASLSSQFEEDENYPMTYRFKGWKR